LADSTCYIPERMTYVEKNTPLRRKLRERQERRGLSVQSDDRDVVELPDLPVITDEERELISRDEAMLIEDPSHITNLNMRTVELFFSDIKSTQLVLLLNVMRHPAQREAYNKKHHERMFFLTRGVRFVADTLAPDDERSDFSRVIDTIHATEESTKLPVDTVTLADVYRTAQARVFSSSSVTGEFSNR